jgi:hypothetical protein
MICVSVAKDQMTSKEAARAYVENIPSPDHIVDLQEVLQAKFPEEALEDIIQAFRERIKK